MADDECPTCHRPFRKPRKRPVTTQEVFDDKFSEARYHLDRMATHRDDPVALTYDLRAFASAARSIIQYLSDAARFDGRQHRYDKLVERYPVLKHFRDLRDGNVHIKPLAPGVAWPAVQLRDSTGRLLRLMRGGKEAILRRRTFVIEPWPFDGNGEVTAACEIYVTALQRLVTEAKAGGLFTSPT